MDYDRDGDWWWLGDLGWRRGFESDVVSDLFFSLLEVAGAQGSYIYGRVIHIMFGRMLSEHSSSPYLYVGLC